MIFQIFRHHNKVLVEQFLEGLNNTLDCSKRIDHTQSVSPAQIHAMQSFAQMREVADSNQMGFAASFVEPDGSNYTITNLPHVNNNILLQRLLTQPFVDEIGSGRVQLVETNEGVQLQILTDAE